MRIRLLPLVTATLIAFGGPVAHAAEAYAAFGFPSVVLGVAQPMNDWVAWRADVGSVGSRSYNGAESGNDYRGNVHYHRAGLFGDWFVAGGGFRLTGGVTFNDAEISLTTRGDGTTVEIGNTTYVTTSADRLSVRVQQPKVTPYFGLGYGHHGSNGPGWRFLFDVGASFGRATVDVSASGPVLGLVSQEDIDAETAELQEGVGKFRVMPQVTFGVGYQF